MSNTIIRVLVVSLSACLLASCGGKKAAQSTEPVGDITRPPIMAKQSAKDAAEPIDPNETISYDEWRKRQDAEADNP